MGDSLRTTVLPAAYAGLAAPFFDEPPIPEPRATCDRCAMCDHGAPEPAAPARAGSEFFHPDLKCCTYHPSLPNFLVGALLADPDPALEEGRRRVRERIRDRIGVTPAWVAPSRKYRVLLEGGRVRGFGRARALACPYLDEGRCSIWRHRESVCSTFFCKHAGGGKGKAFWMAMKHAMAHAELTLSRWAAHEVFPGATEPAIPRLELTVEDLEDRPPSDDEYASYWGEWVGREERFYLECHERVRGLDRERFAALVERTPRGEELHADLVIAHDALTRPSPTEYLVLSPKLRKQAVPGGVAVRGYSGYDPMVLSDDLHAILSELRPGEKASATWERVEREHGVRMPEELVTSLWLHEILVPPPPPED